MQLISLIYFVIFAVMIFSTSLWLIVYFLNREKVHRDPDLSYHPSVTFLVPAYNEEEHVEECIESLLNQDYPSEKLDIIAINDGSTDSTLEKLRNYRDEIQIIDKENTGKANSLNQALEKVDTELVGCMDADSSAEKDFVKSLVGYFEEDGVKGVTPAMKVKNPETWAEKIMWAEYIYNVFLRKLFSIFESQWVMPGPGSLYETKELKKLGGWDEETLTEDMEIAFRIFKHGGKIKNSTNAYVDTESPSDLKGLIRQRTRWYRGYLNNMLAYKEFWFNPRYGNLGMIILPFNILYTSIVVFMLSHMLFNLGTLVYDSIQIYLMLGTLPMNLGISIQSFSSFHLFFLTLGVMGASLLLLSLRTAEEKLNLVERKAHYLLFLTVYGLLYAGFWISAVYHEIKGEKKW